MEYVSYPLIKPKSVQKRLYQESILSSAVKDNTLVVLPTGIGKTIIGVLVAAHTLNKEGGKFIVMAPTKPLVEQHKSTFSKFLDIAKEDLKVFTGKLNPEKREKEYEKYPHIRGVLPALGYGKDQLSDLQETINKVPCDLIIAGTPIDLSRIIKTNKPMVMVTYSLKEEGKPDLKDVLSKFLK